MHTKGEEVAEHRNRGLHPHEGLAVEGEDRQEEDEVGLKMQLVDLIVVEDGEEEFGLRQDEPHKDGEEGEECTRQGPPLSGANPKLGLSSLVVVARC